MHDSISKTQSLSTSVQKIEQMNGKILSPFLVRKKRGGKQTNSIFFCKNRQSESFCLTYFSKLQQGAKFGQKFPRIRHDLVGFWRFYQNSCIRASVLGIIQKLRHGGLSQNDDVRWRGGGGGGRRIDDVARREMTSVIFLRFIHALVKTK